MRDLPSSAAAGIAVLPEIAAEKALLGGMVTRAAVMAAANAVATGPVTIHEAISFAGAFARQVTWGDILVVGITFAAAQAANCYLRYGSRSADPQSAD